MKPSIIRLRALEKQLFAYRYALNTVDFDAETVAPEGSADGRAEACEVLSRASFELLVNADTAALLQQAAAEAEAARLAEYNSEEARFERLRSERDRRLAATDYLLMPDYPLDDTLKENVQAYRQALRDLPSQEGSPWDGGGEETPWPEIPNVLQERQGSSTSSVYTPGVV